MLDPTGVGSLLTLAATLPREAQIAIPLAMPILIVASTGVVILLAGAFMKDKAQEGRWYLLIGLTGLVLACVFLLTQWAGKGGQDFFQALARADGLGQFLGVVFLCCTAFTFIISIDYTTKCQSGGAEYYALLLFATTGMMIMASSSNLIVIFLGIEVMSISSYILAGYFRSRPRSVEAAMKYFLVGAFASAFLFLGIAIIFGLTAQLDTWAVREWITKQQAEGRFSGMRTAILVSMGLLVVGFAFKIASVPFHMWAPDVYEGAPTTVTAFMAAGVKAAAFGAFIRILHSMALLSLDYNAIIWWLAVLTMTVGNLAALVQTNVKRMMAYSSIAHAGYMLIGMYALRNEGGSAVLYYLPAYALASLGAFAIISYLENAEGRGLSLKEYAGISGRYPLLALAMAVFMLSLAGMPPTAGFLGKFLVFRSAIREGAYALCILGILNSVVSLGYYLRVVCLMYMKPAPEEAITVYEGRPSGLLNTAVALVLAGTLWLGFGPHYGVEALWSRAKDAMQSATPISLVERPSESAVVQNRGQTPER